MAARYYNRELLKLRCLDDQGTAMMLEELVMLRNNRSLAHRSLSHLSIALTDLNWIISASTNERGSRVNFTVHLIPHLKKAIRRRAEIFALIGNTGQALADYSCLIGLYSTIEEETTTCIDHRYKELSSMRHPSPSTIIKQNEYTLRLNKQSVNGWKKIYSLHKTQTLPFKHGHSMIVHKSKIYCFGGSNVQYGSQVFERERAMKNHILFWEITIDYQENTKQYYYSWKKLKFDDKYKNMIFARDDITNWSKMVTLHVWNDTMIVFGGYKPFSKVLTFNFMVQKWNVLKTKFLPKSAKKIKGITNHSSVIVADKLYVYGGTESNRLFCLDLTCLVWKQLSGHDNHELDDVSIPEQRFDQFMWADEETNCLFIGYGSFYRKEFVIQCCRRHIWRYDINTGKYTKMNRKGNFPCFRTETGRFIFFGDCFEYSNTANKWKQIQSNTYPDHRALCGLCIVGDLLVVYGGYHGGTMATGRLFNDVWILEMDSCLHNAIKLKECRNCSKSIKTCKLYVCQRCCAVRYCSKHCQKMDWIPHKPKCVPLI
eukprot:432873_1